MRDCVHFQIEIFSWIWDWQAVLPLSDCHLTDKSVSISCWIILIFLVQLYPRDKKVRSAFFFWHALARANLQTHTHTHAWFHLLYSEVTEPELIRSLVLPSHPALSSTPSAELKVVTDRRNRLLSNPFIFIHTNTGLEPLAAPLTQRRTALWLTAISFKTRALTKFTSTSLIDTSPAVHVDIRGRVSGFAVEDNLRTLQLTFILMIWFHLEEDNAIMKYDSIV